MYNISSSTSYGGNRNGGRGLLAELKADPGPLGLETLLADPELPARLAASFAARAAGADPDTVNRELSVLRAAVGWWRAQGWIGGDPSRGLTRLPAPPDRTRALSQAEVAAVFRLDVCCMRRP